MDVQLLSEYFDKYGLICIFIVVFLEYLNLPGFPAGIIMPLAGVWASKGNTHFIIVLLISTVAGLLGSWCLYLLGRLGGQPFFRFYTKKFPKQKDTIEKYMGILREKGAYGVFVAKVIPVLRTLISIPAGMISMDFAKYTVSSAAGVCAWNLAFIGAGYLFGDAVFTIFS